MKTILLMQILFSFSYGSDLVILPKKRPKERELPIKTGVIKKSKDHQILEKLNAQGQRIENLLGKVQERSGVWDFTNQYDFKTGSVIKGTLLNSIVSTNLESPLIVEVDESSSLPKGSRFRCLGVTKHKRIMAACDRLITPLDEEEFEVKVGLLNADGSSGLKADGISTGKEEYAAAAVATAFSKGLIEIGTQKVASPFGELTVDSRKNRLTNGILNSLDETSNLMNSEMRSKEPKAYIEAGRPLLIYFFERFKR